MMIDVCLWLQYTRLMVHAVMLRSLSVLNGYIGNWASHEISMEWRSVLTHHAPTPANEHVKHPSNSLVFGYVS